ncbi:uncharacterized protein LOC113202953 isoform X2 [Frankliniella occidentalis]|uniref:Uncharacterized protein LOC113202953 isoform X2 n=1 Tax=Frankliniella occidentalis TaxID=133901 RepID=A0A9C6U8N7_FRAOC|nr:uncharacterized protein LOC113202953 isoform X2 [Frankliniella occidentalis]
MGELASGATVQAEDRRPATDPGIEKTGLGPLVVINEMMANNHGIPFPFKQLVLSSSGTMMALVLNQIIDVSLLSSVWPLQTVEDLQEALKYFDQIDCEYVYVETV